MTSFLCFYCYFSTYFISFSSVSFVDFEQKNVSWAGMICILHAQGLNLWAISIKVFEKVMLKSIAWKGSVWKLSEKEQLWRSLFLVKLQVYNLQLSQIKRLHHKCLLVNFAIYSRIALCKRSVNGCFKRSIWPVTFFCLFFFFVFF